MPCPSPARTAPEVFPEIQSLQSAFMDRADAFLAQARTDIGSISGYNFSGPQSVGAGLMESGLAELLGGLAPGTTDAPTYQQGAPEAYENTFSPPEEPEYPELIWDAAGLLADRPWTAVLASVQFNTDLSPVSLDELGEAPVFAGERPTYDSLESIDLSVPEPELVGMGEVSSSALDSFPLDFDFGPAPTLRELTLPSAPGVDDSLVAALKAWRAAVPQIQTFDPSLDNDPTLFIYNAIDEGLASLQALAPAVDAALLDVDLSPLHARAVGREEIRLTREEQGILTRFSAAGWAMPTGQLVAELDEARRLAEERISDINREIVVQEAQIRSENARVEYTGQIQREGNWLQAIVGMYNAGIAFVRLAELAYRKAEILSENFHRTQALRIEAWKAQGDGFDTEARIQQTIVDEYRARVQAAGLINDINRVDADIYRARQQGASARASALSALADVFRTRVEAEARKLDQNRDRLALMSERTRLKLAEVEQLMGRLRSLNDFNASLYGTDVQKYGTDSSRYTQLAQAQLSHRTELKSLDIRKIEAELGQADYHIRGYAAYAQAESGRASALASITNALASEYRTQVEAETQRITTGLEIFRTNENNRLEQDRLNLQDFEIQNRIRLQEDELDFRENLEETRLRLQALISISGTSSQLAAGAMSAMSMSTGYSTNFGQSESFSCSGTLE